MVDDYGVSMKNAAHPDDGAMMPSQIIYGG